MTATRIAGCRLPPALALLTLRAFDFGRLSMLHAFLPPSLAPSMRFLL